MKFGKSYMETLASPSFPQEWREGAIEYKQLKKLINGVVAELESLGLGAEVLRDLIVPPEEDDVDTSASAAAAAAAAAGDSEDDTMEHQEIEARDDMRRAAMRASHRRHSASTSPSTSRDLMLNNSSSADDCEACAEDFLQHKEQQAYSSSPAADWVASIAHAKHSHGHPHRSRRRSRHKEGFANSKESDSADAGATNPSHGLDDQISTDDVERDSDTLFPLHDHLPSERINGNGGTHLAPPLAGTRRRSSSGTGRSNLVRSTDDEATHPLPARMGKKDLEAFRRRNSSADRRPSSLSTVEARDQVPLEDRIHDWGGHGWRERPGLKPAPPKPTSASQPKAGKWVQGKDGRRARAEYELGGTSERPIPRIRLFVESPVQSDDEVSAGDEADSEGGEEEDEQNAVNQRAEPSPNGETRTGNASAAAAHDEQSDDDEKRFQELPASPLGSISSTVPIQGVPRSPMLQPQTNGSHEKRRMRTREIVIPLNADTEFLDTLTGALSNLSSLQESQRVQFEQSTEALCKAVSQVASPYGNKNDLYAWREIFALWCELQIFESQREKDRGELSVDETEARLKRFADELAKRGWTSEALELNAEQRRAVKKGGTGGKGALTRWIHHKNSESSLPMKDPRSIAVLEEFLKLNLALLDVKKFQRVNVEAARKILKKHDKRTALTASSDLGAFVAQQESMRAATASAVAGVGMSGLVAIPENSVASSKSLVSSHGAATHPSLAALLPSSTSALMSASLPHILLSLMTTTLLPILPSIDDYSCAICTSVAWRPIRLDCTHLFCIRCLVKLQKQGKSDCPLCRAPGVVGSADERNMDPATVKFLQEWFPKEVSEKAKENEKDRHKEEMLELGLALDNEKCRVM